MKNESQAIILFDGFCPFCHFWVRFVIQRDLQKKFKFAPLKGATAKEFLIQRNLNPDASLVLWLPNTAYFSKSTAVFEIARILGGVFHFIRIFSLLPRFLTDAVYTFVAKNRFKIRKPYTTCPIPEKAVLDRFLE